MKVLIIKMSSLGDVLHTLPALSDAGKCIPGIVFDWVVEESFAQLPSWHPLVHRVIPIAFRRLRKTPIQSLLNGQWRAFLRELRQTKYDLVIDAQGLIKSGLIAACAKGPKAGLDKHSAWEPLASFVYQKKISVNPSQHAVTRVRELFAKALNYDMANLPVDYALNPKQFVAECAIQGNYLLFVHGTTWVTKLWPEEYWIALAKIASSQGYKIYLPWGTEEEKARAKKIAAAVPGVNVLPKCSLQEITAIIAKAHAIVAVDTGLGHIAAALGVPTVSLYGPTDPKQIGTIGDNQIHLSAQFDCAPCSQQRCTYNKTNSVTPACFAALSAEQVWEKLAQWLVLKKKDT